MSSTPTVFVAACVNCYQLANDCNCASRFQKHTAMSQDQYEKGLNDFYSCKAESDGEDQNSICSSCECWWCDQRRFCNPCVKCDKNEPCIFNRDGGCSPDYSDIESPSPRQEVEAPPIITKELSNEQCIFNQGGGYSPNHSSAESPPIGQEANPPPILRRGLSTQGEDRHLREESRRREEEHHADEELCRVDPFDKRFLDYKTMIPLKSKYTTSIPSETAVYVLTNVEIDGERSEDLSTSSKRSKLKINPVSDYWWLSDPAKAKLLVKGGHISPEFKGSLCVQVFNRTAVTVTIPAMARIASLVISNYDYYTFPSMEV